MISVKWNSSSSFNFVMTKDPVMQKPLHWFAEQMD